MPIYEYECAECRRKQSFLVMNLERDLPELRCKKCGGNNLNRLVSRVNVVKSEEARMESLADPSKLGGLDENDPKSMIRWMKKMGQEMGDDLGGEDMDAMIEEAMEEEGKGSPAAGGGLPPGYDL